MPSLLPKACGCGCIMVWLSWWCELAVSYGCRHVWVVDTRRTLAAVERRASRALFCEGSSRDPTIAIQL